tara:strand:- start:13418 stop:14725 length:1308 start_codon:yes stop_codon:yes gene_type:complete
MMNDNSVIGREGTADVADSIRYFLVCYTFASGTMPYDDTVERALERGWTRNEIPEMRTLSKAYNVAKDNLAGLYGVLPVLEELEGWDGQVTQEIKVETLTRNGECRISVRRRGRMNGRDHMEDTPVIRIALSVPDDFDVATWRENYIESAWNDQVPRDMEGIQRLNECISMEPYWIDTEVDVNLDRTIRERILMSFREEATSIDHKSLKTMVEGTVKGGYGRGTLRNGLGGLRWRNQASMYAVRVRARHGDATAAETLDRLESLVQMFAHYNRSRHRWYNENSRTIRQQRKETSMSVIQLIDGERELEYLRQCWLDSRIQSEAIHRDNERKLSQEVLELASELNTESADKIIQRLQDIQEEKVTIASRYDEWSEELEGGVPQFPEGTFREIDEEIERNLSEVTVTLSRLSDDDDSHSVNRVVDMFQTVLSSPSRF